MKHYRQIIINIEVEDDLPEQKLDELVDKVKATVEEKMKLFGSVGKAE